MSAVLGHHKWRIGILTSVLLAAIAIGSAPVRADSVNISVDEAHVIRLPSGVATIVIGNPLIADASLQRGGVLVVTGKGYGSTNLLALDHEGKVIANKTLNVGSSTNGNLVVVYRGTDRESYSCAPQCEPRIMLGDAPGYFTGAMSQTAARVGSAKSNASGSSPR